MLLVLVFFSENRRSADSSDLSKNQMRKVSSSELKAGEIISFYLGMDIIRITRMKLKRYCVTTNE